MTLKLYYTADLEGVWLAGSAIAWAADKKDAQKKIKLACAGCGIPQTPKLSSIKEFVKPRASDPKGKFTLVLDDGVY